VDAEPPFFLLALLVRHVLYGVVVIHLHLPFAHIEFVWDAWKYSLGNEVSWKEVSKENPGLTTGCGVCKGSNARSYCNFAAISVYAFFFAAMAGIVSYCKQKQDESTALC
jgi:hypothetical protein